MNILFLSLSLVSDINSRGVYTDLLREFIKNDVNVYVVTPVERRYNQPTELVKQGRASILKVKTLNIQKTNIIEKGLGTVCLEYQFLSAIKKHYYDIQFDLVLYATPPITLLRSIMYIKKKCNARTYLMLKDIFPQNAVDLDMMQTSGVKSILYHYFRRKEKKLYSISDFIGCMSQANVDYVLKYNSIINTKTVEICPNAIEPQRMTLSSQEKIAMRQRYGIPLDKTIFVYGGNLGKPQGIPFIIDCLRTEKDNDKVFFLIVGDGTEYSRLDAFINDEKPTNVQLMKSLPKNNYDRMIASCDVGLIFLDHRFTIPNFPSRLLSYMQVGIPVLACTDPNTDIGSVITSGDFGWWCESDSVASFSKIINTIIDCRLEEKKSNSFAYLKKYDVKVVYRTIMDHFEG